MAAPRALWTVRETADAIGYKPDTIYRWARRGKIPARRIGRSIRFVPADIERWVNNTKRAGR